jgi:excisionase family DNA binding protein
MVRYMTTVITNKLLDSALPAGVVTDRLLTLDEVASMVGVGVWIVRRWVRSGAIPAVNVGAGANAYWRIRESEVPLFLARRESPRPDGVPA